MRVRAAKSGFSVHAISGTRAIILAMNAKREATSGLMGFAIGWKKNPTDEIKWLRGFKFFKSIIPNPSPGQRKSTLEFPIQSFIWGHYSAYPGQEYHYVIRPMFKPTNGDLEKLISGDDIELSIKTETEDTGTHSVIFNRGAIASQAYADRFGDRVMTQSDRREMLSNPNADETKWLSRGLLEAAIDFIRQANSSRYSLCCCFYELTYTPILNELKRAANKGSNVYVSYETGQTKFRSGKFEQTSTGQRNIMAVQPYLDVRNLHFKQRTNFANLTHNKFMVLLKDGVPLQVWTGSTNITPSGFTGQSNCAHVIRDRHIANEYFNYWELLAKDIKRYELRKYNMAQSPFPSQLPENSTTAIFSPRKGDKELDWYGNQIKNATQTVLLTSAFGVSRRLANYLAEDRDFLRFILMEQKSRGKGVQELLMSDPELRVVLTEPLGASRRNKKIDGWTLDKWFRKEEHFRKRGHIFYIHTKFMAIDPLSDDPKVFTGSANFSPVSLSGNDENMLLIRGNKRVCDIYLTEFNRLFNHFYFRQVANQTARDGTSNYKKAVFLNESDDWVSGHFRSGNYRSKRRELFGIPA